MRLCFRCQKRPGVQTWNICADGNWKRDVCSRCDVMLNRMVLKWSGDPQWREKADAYALKSLRDEFHRAFRAHSPAQRLRQLSDEAQDSQQSPAVEPSKP